MSRNRALDRREEVNPAEVSGQVPDKVLVGKDVLELLTTAMHVEPITIYREYVQNSADAIDEARHCGVLAPEEIGQVIIVVEPITRSVRIRDNGVGVGWPEFSRCLTAIGASNKRGMKARGFRGVGRLAGLGYAQELIFRSRATGEKLVSELRWDCRFLKEALRQTASNGDISELVRSVVSYSRTKGYGYPDRFFEVELNGVVRLGSDKLLNPVAIKDYLAQVAPVPFAPDFQFGADITAALRDAVNLGEIELTISGLEGPVYRPHRNSFPAGSKNMSLFETLEFFEVPSLEGQLAAIGWILHHGYEGAVPIDSLIRGLRLRSGNLQVGDHALLEEFFPEPRFNAWSVGEVHVVDRRIVPNARRDNFEQNAHLNNLLNHVTPVARSIARRCRVSSRKRHLLRQFALEEANTRDRLAVLAQGAISSAERTSSAKAIQHLITYMEKIIDTDQLSETDKSHLMGRISDLRSELQRLAMTDSLESSPLAHLPTSKRRMYENLFGLIYECSTNRVAAKALVDRILHKLQSTGKP